MVDDEDLWHQVTKDITPLGERPKVDIPKNTRPKIRENSQKANPLLLDEKIIFGADEPTKNIAQTQIHKREARRIARGTMSIDSTVDLHGVSRERAYKMLYDHLSSAFVRGEKLVLVITGKGGKRFAGDAKTPLAQKRFSDIDRDEGVIKKALPGWLQGGDLNSLVASYKISAPQHGGGGAFYVRLRRNKP